MMHLMLFLWSVISNSPTVSCLKVITKVFANCSSGKLVLITDPSLKKNSFFPEFLIYFYNTVKVLNPAVVAYLVYPDTEYNVSGPIT